MTDSCDYAKLSNTPCGKLLYARHTGRKNIKELHGDLKCIFLWRARLLEEKDNVFTICFHHEQFFGKVFKRETETETETDREREIGVAQLIPMGLLNTAVLQMQKVN